MKLTEQERAILDAVTRGLQNKHIAAEMFLSEQTVKYHLTKLYRKLGVTNRTAAARWAWETPTGRGQ